MYFVLQFFLKATQLDQMSTDYQVILEEQGITEASLSRKSEVSLNLV